MPPAPDTAALHCSKLAKPQPFTAESEAQNSPACAAGAANATSATAVDAAAINFDIDFTFVPLLTNDRAREDSRRL